MEVLSEDVIFEVLKTCDEYLLSAGVTQLKYYQNVVFLDLEVIKIKVNQINLPFECLVIEVGFHEFQVCKIKRKFSLKSKI